MRNRADEDDKDIKTRRRRSAPLPWSRRKLQLAKFDDDGDLIRDTVSTEIIFHPVVASDGRVYEAASLLAIMQSGGKSPFARAPLTFATYLYPLKTNLDNKYGAHPDRHSPYDVKPVLEQIQQWIKTWQVEPLNMALQREENFPADDDAPAVPAAAAPVAAAPAVVYPVALNRAPIFSFFKQPAWAIVAETFFVSEVIIVLLAMSAHISIIRDDQCAAIYPIFGDLINATGISLLIGAAIGSSVILPRRY